MLPTNHHLWGHCPNAVESVSPNSIERIPKGAHKIHFPMLYENHSYVLLENFPKNCAYIRILIQFKKVQFNSF